MKGVGMATRITKKNGRRSYRDIFLDKLRELVGTEQKLISNAAVKDALGWEDEQYKRVKSQLLDENLVVVGRGYGGSVGLANAPGSKALTLFISYSHVDEALKNELLKHLAPLKRLKLIEAWHDRKLKAGDDLDHEISTNLEKADIAIFLLSVDFINSQYCYDVELEKALELHAKGSLVVVPVVLRSCLWQHTPLAKLLALPKDGKAVTAWADRDEALTDVADGLRLKAIDVLGNK
jgi:TIR domain